ncbi:MAG: hypothetical protein KGM15_02320 [Pseudomonadota bacterium]|nr:hypothetical protein [Pseudomonadota bacterium]
MHATLITCSFRGDLDVCRLLCRSIDLYACADFEHRLYAPARDLPLFADLASALRRIATQESLLPRWLWTLPLPRPEWRERLGLPRRNVYLSLLHGPVRGWIAQQLMKIAASLAADDEIIAHIDSDSALVAPLTLAHLRRDGRTRLYAGEVAERHAGHALRCSEAARLLGLPAGDYYRAEYIAPLVVWRRPVVRAMAARIEEATGGDWARALAATRHFSEYVLYGVFARHGLGVEAAGLRAEAGNLSLARWVASLDDPAGIDEFVAQARADQLVCCLKSTLAVSLPTRAAVYRCAGEAIAALQAPARDVAA